MKNNGIKLKTWENFSKLKQEIETMLDKKINNDYLLNLLIIEGKMITFGKTIEYKIEKVVIPLDTLEVNNNNPDKQCKVSISENKGEIDVKGKEEKP